MTSIDRPTIRVSNATELVAVVPYLVGFQPDLSLVVLAMAERTIVTVARIDLPTSPATVAPLRAALDTLAATLTAHRSTDVLLVGYGSAAQVTPAIQAATAAMRAVALPVGEALRVAGGRFYSLTCPYPACCPPEGTAFEAATSIAAAAATAAGLVALPNREALAAYLEPVTGAAREAMEAATIAAAESLIAHYEALAPGVPEPDTSPSTALGRALLSTSRRCLQHARQQYQAGRSLSDHEAALLTFLLELPSVRDVAARASTGAPWQIRMWSDLTRRAQPDLSVAPATLLGLAALQAGNGPLADVATRRALSLDPDDALARTLARAIAAGIDPATATALLAD